MFQISQKTDNSDNKRENSAKKAPGVDYSQMMDGYMQASQLGAPVQMKSSFTEATEEEEQEDEIQAKLKNNSVMQEGVVQRKTPVDGGKQKRAKGTYNPIFGEYSTASRDKIDVIAKRFSVTVEELKKANPNLKLPLKAGTLIDIPGFVMPNDPQGKHTNVHTKEEYRKKWEAKHGKKMTAEQKAVLSMGCIGITALNLGVAHNPPLNECFTSFELALRRAQEIHKDLTSKGLSSAEKVVVFSKRFYSAGKDYKPDAKGKVDMGHYDIQNDRRSIEYANFDYGFYDVNTGNWWHANHMDPGMKVYESTLEQYSRNLDDFDQQVYCVGISKL